MIIPETSLYHAERQSNPSATRTIGLEGRPRTLTVPCLFQ